MRAQRSMQTQARARTSVIADSPLVLGVDDCRGLRACGSTHTAQTHRRRSLAYLWIRPDLAMLPVPNTPHLLARTCVGIRVPFIGVTQQTMCHYVRRAAKENAKQDAGAKIQNTGLRSLHWGHRINEDRPC